MFAQVRVHNQNEEARVEELGDEHLIRNGRLLLTARVLADPNDQFDDNDLEDDVNGDNDESNGLTDYFRHDDVPEVLPADWPLVQHVVSSSYQFVVRAAVHFVQALYLAEALQRTGEVRLPRIQVVQVFVDGFALEHLLLPGVILGELRAIYLRVLVFERQ